MTKELGGGGHGCSGGPELPQREGPLGGIGLIFMVAPDPSPLVFSVPANKKLVSYI